MRHLLKTVFLTTSCSIVLMTACGEESDTGSEGTGVTGGSSSPGPSGTVPGPSATNTQPQPTPQPTGNTGATGGNTGAGATGGNTGATGGNTGATGGNTGDTGGPAPTTTAPEPTQLGAGGAGGTPSDPAPTSSAAGGAGGGTGEGGAGGTPMGMGGMPMDMGMGGSGPAPGGEFSLTSSAFNDGEELPDEFTCEGKPFGTGPMPDLTWTPGPEGTLSYAVTFIDLTLSPDSNAYHWALWDIPASVTSLPGGEIMGAMPAEPAGSKQYSALGAGFLGPCPGLVGPMTDEYAFVVYALSVETIPDPPNDVMQLEQMFLENSLDTAELNCTSDATSSGFGF